MNLFGLRWLRMTLLLAGLCAAGCDRRDAPRPGSGVQVKVKPFRNLVAYSPPKKLTVGMRQLRGLALDDKGLLYAASAEGIAVFTREGRRLRCPRTSGPANCVAVDKDGKIYAGLKDRIEMFDAKGRALGAWGKAGRGNGQLSFVTAIELHEANVFVADAGNRCIQRFDTTGDFINRIAKRGDADDSPGLHLPSLNLDLDVDDKGVLHVTNTGKLRVERYNANGDLLGHWGEPGLAPDRFCGCCNPIHVGLAREGRIVTVEKGLPRIKVHDASGKLLAVLGAGMAPVDPTGIDQSAQPGSGARGSQKLRNFFGDVVVDSEGTIFVASPRIGAIYAFYPKERGTSSPADSDDKQSN